MATYPVELAPGASKEGKVCVAVGGGGGFIGSWLALDLKKKGFYVICADWKRNEFMEVPEFCDEFHLADLRIPANCLRVCDGCRDVYNLAADMGGMGFIQSNHSRILFNSTMISFNMAEAARVAGVKRFWCAAARPRRADAALPLQFGDERAELGELEGAVRVAVGFGELAEQRHRRRQLELWRGRRSGAGQPDGPARRLDPPRLPRGRS